MKKIMMAIVLGLLLAAPFAAAAKNPAPLGKAKEVIEKAQIRREAVQRINTELQKCINVRTTECQTKRKNARNLAIENLGKIADQALAMLAKTKERIEASELEKKASMLEEINAQIAEVEKAKDAISKMGDATTKGEIKEATKTIREAWKKANFIARKHAHKSVSRKLNAVLQKTEKLETRIQEKLNKLKEAGKDTSGVTLDAFNSAIEEARKYYDDAQKLLEEAESYTGEKRAEKIKEANETLKKARDAIKTAHAELREILKKIRELGAEEQQQEQAGEEAQEQEQAVEQEQQQEAEQPGNETEQQGNETAI